MDPEEKRIYSIPLKDIKISKCNARTDYDQERIKELAESIRHHGLLQPVVLRGTYGHPPYELIIGSRRFLAHQMLNKEDILATFSGKLKDVDAAILSLGENMQRVELNHAEKAEAITALYLFYGKDDRRVAKELGLHLRTVRDYIKIEERATPKAKKLLRERKISKADLKRAIDAAQGNAEKVDRLLDKFPQLTSYEQARAVNYGKENPTASSDKILDEAKKPRVEHTIILNLPIELDKALNKAVTHLSMDRESIAMKALTEWLEKNGFIGRA